MIDGDTLDFGGVLVRVHGIDAPERGQTCDRNGQAWDCGAFARRMMADLASAGKVTCDAPVDIDRYNRAVAVCHVAGRDLGAEMVVAGAAVAYRAYSMAYVRQEQAAQAAGRGIWAGRVVTPQAWRHADTAPRDGRGCTVKGNIRDGRHIYHLPGDRYYEETRVKGPGEAWFCSAADAEAAGFRRAGS